VQKFIRRLNYWFRRSKLDADMAEELEFHQAMVQRDLEQSGLGADRAFHAGRLAMGNATLAREDSRAVWIWPWLQSVWQDLDYAARSFRRQPRFALVAIVALALAIGLNTSLFTVFNAIALRPWPVKEPGRVVKVFSVIKNPAKGFDNVGGFSLGECRYFAEHSKSMTGFFATRGEGGIHMDSAKVRVEYVSGSYFRVLGVEMESGRGFLPEEDRADRPVAVAVLSHTAWQNRFGGDPGVIGRPIRVEDAPFTIVGVAPPVFGGTSPELTDLWIPHPAVAFIRPNESWVRSFLHDPNFCCSDIAGRLAPGVTREQARAELSLLSADFRRQFNEKSDGVILSGTAILQKPGRKTRQIYGVFSLMFTGVMLVLLLACANVGNLLLARASARRREIGIRLSLGAGRRRIIRQLLTESLALAGVAAIFGVCLACVSPGPLFTRVVGQTSFHLQPDATVLAYTLGLAVLACLAFGLAPALHATRSGISGALRQRLPLRSFLLAVQVAISVILLTGAGLLIRGIQHVRSQDPGFAIQDIASLSFEFPIGAYKDKRIGTFFQDLTHGLDGVPGAQPFGLSVLEPLGTTRGYRGFRLPNENEKQERPILINTVSAGYFDVLRIPIVAGRNFEPADSGRGVVLVNQAMVNRYLPGENPVGKTIVVSNSPFEIAGVVRNAHTWALDEVEPAIYSPISFGVPPRLLLHNTPANVAAVTALVKNLDPRVQMKATPLSENLDRWLDSSRIGAMIAGMLGILALSLASIGISGVFAYAVQQRTQEIGIRVALGAQPRQVAAVVLGSAARSLAAGLAVGFGCALAGSRMIRQYLFGLSSADPVTYAAVIFTLAFAGLLATYLPTRRAIRLNPIKALHYE